MKLVTTKLDQLLPWKFLEMEIVSISSVCEDFHLPLGV